MDNIQLTKGPDFDIDALLKHLGIFFDALEKNSNILHCHYGNNSSGPVYYAKSLYCAGHHLCHQANQAIIGFRPAPETCPKRIKTMKRRIH